MTTPALHPDRGREFHHLLGHYQKSLVSIRLDHDVLDALRASGPGWQTRANAMLRKALKET